MRLNFLSRQPEIILDSPQFDSRLSALEDSSNTKDHDLDRVSGKGSASSCFQDIGSPQTSQSSFKIEHSDHLGITLDRQSQDAPSPSSGTIRIWRSNKQMH